MITSFEMTGRRLSTGADEVLRFTDAPYRTGAGDTPSLTWFNPRISTRPSLGRVLAVGTGTYGETRASSGNVSLSNFDGQLDALAWDYAFDGRSFAVRMGDSATPYADWTLVMSGKLDDVKVDGNQVQPVIRDRLKDLAKPLPRNKYLGNNVAPDGVEGTPDDLKDQYKPRVYGSSKNITPKCVNTSKLIYQVSDQDCTISAVKDLGVALTLGADYASVADMLANAPAAGTYRRWKGYVRLGTLPSLVTVDVSTAETRVASLIQQIALDAGLVAGDINTADVAALNALNSAPAGVWVDGDMTAQQAMDFLAGSIGARYGFDRTNVLRMRRISAPAGVPVKTYGKRAIKSARIREAGIPAPSVIVRYARNYTVMTQPASSVAASEKAWLAEQYRSSLASDNTVLANWPSAQQLTFDTGLVNQADADAESARLQALYGVRRTTVDVDVFVSELGEVDLGDEIGLDWPRYGLGNRTYLLIGIDSGFAAGLAKLVLWG